MMKFLASKLESPRIAQRPCRRYWFGTALVLSLALGMGQSGAQAQPRTQPATQAPFQTQAQTQAQTQTQLQAQSRLRCTTQSQMSPDDRDALVTAAHNFAEAIEQANTTLLRAQSIPLLAQQFDAVERSVAALAPEIRHATITVEDLYQLNALHQSAQSSQASFFCGLPGSLLTVEMHFPALPAGQYAVVIVHATGVAHPQSLTFVFEQSPAAASTTNAGWLLAGFFPRPLTMATHDGLWYWTEARGYTQRQMHWNAWLYYQAARALLLPAPFMVSPNLEKLDAEAAETRPVALAHGVSVSQPLILSAGNQSFRITRLWPTDALGPLDLALTYQPAPAQAAQLADATAARQQVMTLARALLAAHPELAVAFHGFWIHAGSAPSSAPSSEQTSEQTSAFALELPMAVLEPSQQVSQQAGQQSSQQSSQRQSQQPPQASGQQPSGATPSTQAAHR